jgi:hypothetical protein
LTSKDAIKFIVLGFEHWRAVAIYTCIVEGCIKLAVGSDRLAEHCRHLAPIRHVARDREDFMAGRAQLTGCIFEQRRVVICDDQGRASFSKGDSRGETDTPAGPGHERNLSLKQLHGHFPY